MPQVGLGVAVLLRDITVVMRRELGVKATRRDEVLPLNTRLCDVLEHYSRQHTHVQLYAVHIAYQKDCLFEATTFPSPFVNRLLLTRTIVSRFYNRWSQEKIPLHNF